MTISLTTVDQDSSYDNDPSQLKKGGGGGLRVQHQYPDSTHKVLWLWCLIKSWPPSWPLWQQLSWPSPPSKIGRLSKRRSNPSVGVDHPHSCGQPRHQATRICREIVNIIISIDISIIIIITLKHFFSWIDPDYYKTNISGAQKLGLRKWMLVNKYKRE